MSAVRLCLASVSCVLALSGVAGCGAKTGLRIPELDAGMRMDAAVDAGRDTGIDAPIDAGQDALPPCVPGMFELAPARADVVFTIDRSGSMALSIDGDEMPPPRQTRWFLLRQAMDAALDSVGTRVRIGAKFYPDPVSMPMVPEDACRTSPGIDVAPRIGGASEVIRIFDETVPIGGTPTALAVAAARDELERSEASRRFIVLATDGGPNCNPGLDARTCLCTGRLPEDCSENPDTGRFSCLDDTRTLATLQNTFSIEGIPVYVVGIEDPTRPELSDLLDRMAVAGGRPRMVPGERQFYSADSAADLSAALDEITSSIVRCAFVSPSVPDTDEGFRLEVDGEVIPRDEMGIEGWRWTNRAGGEMELAGESCELAQRAGARIIGIVDRCGDGGL